MVSTSDDNTTTNKGVNARSESLPVAIHKTCCDLDTSTSSVSSLHQRRSLDDVKHEIQNVLDLMGPSTPNYTTTQNTSSEADNEDESIISFPSASQKTKLSKASQLERDRTVSTDTEKIESIMTDAGTISSTNNFNSLEVEHACYDHQKAGPCLCLNPECICMVGYMNQVPLPPREPCLNPECVCMVSYMNQESVRVPVATQSDFLNLRANSQGYISTNKSATRVINDCGKKRSSLLDWLKERSVELIMKKSSMSQNPCELYKINICEDGGRPKRVVFDLVDGIPKPSSSNVATNTIRSPVEKYKSNFKYRCDDEKMVTTCNCKGSKNLKNEKIQETQHMSRDCNGDTRADFYYFDHGNAQYFHTTDTAPVMVCEVIAEKTEKYTTRFWAEIFATIHIAFSFLISFVLQLFKFVLYGILRPLTVGLMQLSSDYCFKPFLTTLFNGIVQPCLIFLYNVATSVRDLCDPIAECCGYFLRELAVLFRAIRLCTYKKNVDDNCECRASPCDEKKRKYIC